MVTIGQKGQYTGTARCGFAPGLPPERAVVTAVDPRGRVSIACWGGHVFHGVEVATTGAHNTFLPEGVEQVASAPEAPEVPPADEIVEPVRAPASKPAFPAQVPAPEVLTLLDSASPVEPGEVPAPEVPADEPVAPLDDTAASAEDGEPEDEDSEEVPS